MFCYLKENKYYNYPFSAIPSSWDFLKFFLNKKVVYDCHELETEKYGLNGIRKKIAKITEKVLIKYTDLVVVVSESIHDWYLKEYNLKNVIIVKNTPYTKFEGDSEYFRKKFKIPIDNKIILYLGGLFEGRNINKLLKEFDQIKNSKLSLIFMGYGTMENQIKKYAQINKNIYLHNAVEIKNILEYASSADIGIAYMKNGSLNDDFCLPNKFFEYIFSGLPVITSNTPDMARIINKYNIGTTISKIDSVNLINAIKKVEEIDKSDLKKSLLKAYFHLNWNVQENNLLKAFKELLLE